MKVVSERLGHANVAFTIETYQHVLPGMQATQRAPPNASPPRFHGRASNTVERRRNNRRNAA